LPAEWLGEVIQPTPVEPAVDAQAQIGWALDHPLGSLPLAQLARPSQPVTILVDDYSRPTPVSLLLTPLLERLAAAGARPQDIRLVVAPGSHRRMSPDELRLKIGGLADQGGGILLTPQIQAGQQEEMVYTGRTPGGVPVWVNRWVAEESLRIGLGTITPHMDAGYSGGAKIILPGACALQTIDAFHALAARFPGNPLGNPDAPLRLDLERFVQERIPLDFIANLVLTSEGEVYGCAAGDAVQAQRQGAALSRQVYGAPASRRYPIVVAGCTPYDHDLWQSCKGLWCGELLVAHGGELIWQTTASEGCGSVPLLTEYLGWSAGELEGLVKRSFAAGNVDLKAAATALMINRMKQRLRITLVSPAFSRGETLRMGLGWAPNLEAALFMAVTRLAQADRAGCTAWIPQAGTTLPFLSSDTNS
jgi:nickel-dependent lactate racemase